jgi:hypothetical protein
MKATTSHNHPRVSQRHLAAITHDMCNKLCEQPAFIIPVALVVVKTLHVLDNAAVDSILEAFSGRAEAIVVSLLCDSLV